MRIVETTPPAEEPVSLAEQKLHSRVDYDADDSLIEGLIVAARQYCEARVNRAFVTTSFELRLNHLPCRVELPRAPVVSVDEITYTDSLGVEQTLAADQYAVADGDAAYIVPAYGVAYPVVRCQPDSVRIAFTAGYGAATAVPEGIKAAIRLVVSHLYENREATTETALATVPMAVDALLSVHAWGGYW